MFRNVDLETASANVKRETTKNVCTSDGQVVPNDFITTDDLLSLNPSLA